MNCPSCGHSDFRVIDTRPYGDGLAIRRRRCCQSCGVRFSTIETVEKFKIPGRPKKGSVKIPQAIPKSQPETRRALRELFLRTKERVVK